MTLLPISFLTKAEVIPLSTGDILRITVYDNSDLTTEARISSDGSISFPLIGEIGLSGLSAREAENEISDRLINGGFLKDAQVNVIVLDSRSQQISILGQVSSPGKYRIDISAKNVIDFISLAGGRTSLASETIIVIKNSLISPTRYMINLDHLLTKGDLSALTSDKMNLGSGDILYVPKAPVFFIYGEVNRPGQYQLTSKMTVAQALSLGGGISDRGDDDNILIKRFDKDGVLKEIDVNEAYTVFENDTIYIKESFF